MRKSNFIMLITGLLLLPSFCPNATGENNGFPEFKSFELITQRNIFDPTRRKYVPRKATPRNEQPRKVEPKKRVDRFDLLGMMTYDGQGVAIFEGSEKEFNVEIKLGEKISGFNLVAMNTDKITLSNGTKNYELKIGTGMQRAEGEDWKLASDAGSYKPAERKKSVVIKKPETSSGESSSREEILKRMMERRQKELDHEKAK